MIFNIFIFFIIIFTYCLRNEISLRDEQLKTE